MSVNIHVVSALTLGAFACAPFAVAQGSTGALSKQETGYRPERTSFGQPDLQGYWTNSSATSVTRPPGLRDLEVDDDVAAAFVAKQPFVVAQNKQEEKFRTGELSGDSLPESGNAKSASFAQEGYNTYWMDVATRLMKINGNNRTSWIVEPADGQLPFTAGGKTIVDEYNKMTGYNYAEGGNYSDPELLPAQERCIIGFTAKSGPLLMSGLYNGNYQIVQTPNHVVIQIEMIHDARIVPLNAIHGPAVLRPWFGDSTGWWDGDTLVVETRNVNPLHGLQGPIYLSKEGKVVERFTRTSADAMLYEFEVTDPVFYSAPIRGEVAVRRGQRIYEYACHEGNYAMPNILGGSRIAEAQATSAKKPK
ncbi:MAG: hypothetical protein ABL956_15170 [Hyphomonadaceae bacterium]